MKSIKDKKLFLLKKYQEMPLYESVNLTRFDQPSKYDKDTPLHWACYNESLEELKIMLATNVNINVRGDIGNTPLHEACIRANLDIIKLLLKHGADCSIKNDYEEMPIDLLPDNSSKKLKDVLLMSKNKKN